MIHENGARRLSTVVIAVFIVLAIIFYSYTSSNARYEGFSCESCGGSSHEGFAQFAVGSNSYKMHEDLNDPQQGAILMDKLNTVAHTLIDHLTAYYVTDPKGIEQIKPEWRRDVRNGIVSLKRNFVTAHMEENIPERSGGDTSYVVDKGDVFAMCIRDPKKDNKLEGNFNELSFVLIHEMSHLACAKYGHPVAFWRIFRFMLQEAANIGLYRPVEYSKTRPAYCGIVITYSPLYDLKLEEMHIITSTKNERENRNRY